MWVARVFKAAWMRRGRPQPGAQFVLPGMLIVAFITVVVALEIHVLKFTPVVPHAPDPIVGFILFVAPTVGAISAIVVFAEFVLRKHDQTESKEPEYPAPDDKWPTGPIAWVRVRDHYLEIKTLAGRTSFVRGKMTYVTERLADEDGLQIHRSWWVARAALLRVERRGRDQVAILKDGEEVSIGRSRIDTLRAKGWL